MNSREEQNRQVAKALEVMVCVILVVTMIAGVATAL